MSPHPLAFSAARLTLVCAILVVPASISACGGWQRAQDYDGWTLFEMPGDTVEASAFEAAFTPAMDSVERHLGKFEKEVAVHAWNGSVRITEEGRSRVRGKHDHGVHEVPGIGPAKIQAYHSRGGRLSASGVYIGAPDPGIAAHELVHARIAEQEVELPLWFEEGVACLLGDGILYEGRWVVDGLACWPLRELREEQLAEAEIERLVRMELSDQTSVRDNILIHFIGWAVVFDMYRETGRVEWREWMEELNTEQLVLDVRRRLDRTLRDATSEGWLSRLRDPDPGVRLATAKGLWKLRSHKALESLIEALQSEQVSEVRVGLAVNALAAAGELSLSSRRWGYLRRTVERSMQDLQLESEREHAAVFEMLIAYRIGDESSAHAALNELSRFWRE